MVDGHCIAGCPFYWGTDPEYIFSESIGRGNLFGDARCEHELQITTTRQYLVYWPSDSWWHSKHGPTSNHSKGKGIPQQFRRSNSTGCTTWLVRLLPHAKFPDLKTTLSVTYECWGILSRSLMIKNVPKHRAYPTYNISKARPKRISSPKVVLILLLKFIFPSHGTKQHRYFLNASQVLVFLNTGRLGSWYYQESTKNC